VVAKLNKMETKITKTWKVKGSKKETYELTIKFMPKQKLIYFIDCTCPDFYNRRLKGNLEFSDKTTSATPCKHLKPYIKFYEKVHGFKLKVPKQMEGTEKPTAQLRKALIERSGGLCEANCGNLGRHIHRKIRGSNGGKYSEENCVYLCENCHKAIHGNEFKGSKGK